MAEFLSLLIGKLLDYTVAPVGRQFGYLFCYGANLEEFKTQLSGMERLRNDMKLRVEADERNGKVIFESVKEWLAEVGAASDESRHFVEEEDAISKRCFNGPLNLKVRHQRSRKAKKKASEFDKIRERGKFAEVAVAPPPLQILLATDENVYDFESRRLILHEIQEAMKDDGVRMIGIWGMPGIGKTTLVKRAAKYAKDGDLFEKVAMAVVSQNPNVKAIQGQIADEIGLELTRESERGRAGQLLQCLLARKKILIILDDIWDRIELNDIGIPSASQHKGCKIILTTRKKAVCHQMKTEKNFQIDLLGPDEALYLFQQMSGVNDQSSELSLLAKKVSDKCGRLPICIVIVARGLVNKPRGSWEDMANRLNHSDIDKKVFDVINFSYDNIDREEEQMFFLLCALFPEDYRIEVQVLFEYGLGLNLFEKVDNLDEAAVRAQNLAAGLKLQCLLLDEGYEKFVKMHDVIRDAALVIASKGKYAFLVQTRPQCTEWLEKTAISLWSNDVNKLSDALECPQLQILMLKCGHKDLQIHDNFFAGMKNLLVLDFSHVELIRLPQSFASLENLRTLRFDSCQLGDISSIGKLQKLVSLSFYRSTIEVLPKEVGQLSNLRFLDFFNCPELRVITPGVIQNLSQLEVLLLPQHFGSTILSELNYLSQLIVLNINLRDASMLPDDVLFKNLKKSLVSIGKSRIERINIFSSSSATLNLERVSKNELSKSGIKILMIKAYHMELKNISGISVALPSPLGGYGTLKELVVDSCGDINYVFDMSGSEYEKETPSLQLLHLIDLPSMEKISRGKFLSLLFSKLEHIKLGMLPNLVRLWPFQAESNLTTMKVESCDKLEYVFDLGSAKGLSKLKKLEVRNCRNLEVICQSNEQDDGIVFPQLSHLQLLDLENLVSFGSKSTSGSTLFDEKINFPILESIELEGLKSVKKIWHDNISTKCFSQLQRLYVYECDQLVGVFPSHLEHGGAKIFSKLDELKVRSCRNLEAICVTKEQDEEIVFRQLSDLELSKLEKLASFSTDFFSGSTLFGQKVNFPNLKSIELEGLQSVKKIWHDNVSTKCFSQLQKLYVYECDQLVWVFPSHLEHGGAKKFSKLKKLEVRKCRNLEVICVIKEQDEEIVFRQLNYLQLSELEKVASFSTDFFSRSILFGQKVNFPVLKSMRLKSLKSLKKIWHDNVSSKYFSHLQELFISECDQLVVVFPYHLAPNLNCLEQVRVEQCHLLGGKGVLQTTATLPKLKNLVLNLDHEPIEWRESLDQCGGFQSLTSLDFSNCNGLKSLLTPLTITALVQLQRLSVTYCESIESIIVVENFDISVEFYKLKTVELDNLPCLASFYNGAYGLKFPCLDCLSIKSCPKMKTLASKTREMLEPSCLHFVSEEELFGQQVSFGRLRELSLEGLELIGEIWHRDHATTVGELRRLIVVGCNRLLKILPSILGEGLQNLEFLYVESCRSLEHVFAVEDHPPILSNLKRLILDDLSEMKQLWWNKNNGQSFGLSSLSALMIKRCSALEFIFDPSIDNGLQNLTYLAIDNCSSMVEIVAEKSGKKIDFPLLQSLKLVNLPCFKVKQDVEFPLAENVSVDRCFNMKTSCYVNVKKQLARPVRYFESFVELMNAERDSSTLDSNEDLEVIRDEPTRFGQEDHEVEGVGENSRCDH